MTLKVKTYNSSVDTLKKRNFNVKLLNYGTFELMSTTTTLTDFLGYLLIISSPFQVFHSLDLLNFQLLSAQTLVFNYNGDYPRNNKGLTFSQVIK